MRRYFILPVLVAAVVVMLAAPAQAQATRTWVSGGGSDANPCSRTEPCVSFPSAYGKTAAGGEINCLDSSGYGAINITKSITINCEGTIGGILASGAPGVIVNAGPTDVVVLRGLDIEGAPPAFPGLRGISFITGAALHVQNCTIRNFRGEPAIGINFAPTGASELFVSNTTITSNGTSASNSGHFGVQIKPTGAGTAKAVLDHVDISNNIGGFRAESTNPAGTIDVTIVDSIIAGNTFNGLVANSAGQGAVQIMLDHVSISNNGAAGIRGDGNAATIRMRNSVVTGNTTGANLTNGAELRSYGNNSINGNGSSGSAPTIIPQQ
jgi:hypothetical protein